MKYTIRLKHSVLLRAWALLLAAAFVFAAVPAIAHAETALASGFVNTGALNMRKGAGTSYALVDELKKNDVVNVYEVAGTWLRVDVPALNKSGYVSAKYITLDNASLTAIGLGVTTGKVHLRKSATASSDSLAIVEKNAGLIVLSRDKTSGWYRVKAIAQNREGYISNRYVKVTCETGDAPFTGTKKGYVNASRVNFRKGAGTTYASLGKLEKNAAVTVSDKSGDWYYLTVTATGKKGYVFASFITLSDGTAPTPTPTPTSSPATGTGGRINASGVNFRKGPSTKYASIGSLSKNTALIVLGTSGSWYQVSIVPTNEIGYVFSSYVTADASVTASPATGKKATINAIGVNLRTGPSSSYTSLGLLSKGTALTITGTSGSWTQVCIVATGKTGYVFTKYVTTESAATADPTNAKPAAINAVGVNLRTGPSTSYKSLGLLEKGAQLTVTGTSGSWYQVIVVATGRTGYVYKTYVTLTAATPSPATPSPATLSPATPSPATPSPATPSPATPSPATPSPATPSPATPSPAA